MAQEKKLEPGVKFTNSLIVTDKLTVPALSSVFGDFHDMPPVFATPYLVAFVEWTCLTGLQEYLEPGQRTVGTNIAISHGAATPVGMKVTCEAEVASVKGKLLEIKVVCRDEVQVISEGVHGRAIIDYEKFMSKFRK